MDERLIGKSLYEKALNHDFAEVFTGDIKTPVKYASSELKKLFSQVEEEMVETFIEEEIPLQYRDVYKQRLQEGKDDSLEAKYFQLLIKLICFMKHLEKYKNVIPKNYFSKFMK
ncbi:hydrolase [Staphylococcus aureus]|uniref:Hydrolase n=1 Tax=Staphylococcus aureus TaxID=1280 RepID=A0A380EHB0_STAAU|nr:hydrolase [Staphylococcus aureus]